MLGSRIANTRPPRLCKLLKVARLQYCIPFLYPFLWKIKEGEFTDTWDFVDGDMASKVCRDWMGVSAAVKGNLKD